MTTPSPASLRQLAADHMNDGPPYVKHLYEACQGLRWAADEIERCQTYWDHETKRADTLTQQLAAAQSEATFQKERADGYSGWITEFEKREEITRLRVHRTNLKNFLAAFDECIAYQPRSRDESTDLKQAMFSAAIQARDALEGEGENE